MYRRAVSRKRPQASRGELFMSTIKTARLIFVSAIAILFVTGLFISAETSAEKNATGPAPTATVPETLTDRSDLMAAFEEARDAEQIDIFRPTEATAFSLQTKLIANDGAANDQFGVRVAVLGDTALIGAWTADISGRSDQGAAYLFQRSGNSWSFVTKLFSTDGEVGDNFGYSVAISSATEVLVGAFGNNAGGLANGGAVYVFRRGISGTWFQAQKLTSPDPAANDVFGNSVAADGSFAIIGANGDDQAGNDAGAAYIFEFSSGIWTFRQKLPTAATIVAAGDGFGWSVDIHGTRAIVGAPYHDTGAADADTGGYCIFQRTGSNWSVAACQIQSTDTTTGGEQAGWSVAISEDHFALGIPNIDASGTDAGGVALCNFPASCTFRYPPATGSAGAKFGSSVAADADLVAVGSPGDFFEMGRVVIYGRIGGTWVAQPDLKPSPANNFNLFGSSVAVSGSTVVVGANGDDLSPTANNQGSAYVFTGFAEIPSPTPTPTPTPSPTPQTTCSFSNGGLLPRTVSESGVPAPAGTFFSEVQHDDGETEIANGVGGFFVGQTSTRLADNFSTAQTCAMSTVAFYAYLTDPQGSFTGATLQIWNGRPGDPGSSVIFGDKTTNRLASSTDTAIYRIFNSAVPPPGVSPAGAIRKIYRNIVNVNTVLPAGEYWLDWAFTNTSGIAAAPAKTIAGRRGEPGDNARLQSVSAGSWSAAVDSGLPSTAPDVPQDFPFDFVGFTGGVFPTPTPLPVLTVEDNSVLEGNSGTGQLGITVRLSRPATAGGVRLSLATQNDTAIAGQDYFSYTLNDYEFSPGSTTVTFLVPVIGDTAFEPNEAFFFIVSNVQGATVGDGQAVGTIINDDPVPTPTPSPTLSPTPEPTPSPTQTPTSSISGVITYGTTPTGQATRFVPGVMLAAAGAVPSNATTDATGAYTLNELGAGPYTVTPSKSGDVNGISGLDAARVAQHVAGLITLTPNQQIAGDATNNGSLSGLDAARIAQFAAGLSNPGIAGQWKFLPPQRTYASVSGPLSGESYEAILVGDVTGNWSAAAPRAGDETEEVLDFSPAANNDFIIARGDYIAEKASDAVEVMIGNDEAGARGGDLSFPIFIGDTTGKGVIAYDFTVVYDPAVIRPEEAPGGTAGTLSDGWSVVHNPEIPGLLRVSGFSTAEMVGRGVLIRLRFAAAEQRGRPAQLSFTQLQFNEGEVCLRILDSMSAYGEVIPPVGGELPFDWKTVGRARVLEQVLLSTHRPVPSDSERSEPLRPTP
jgi:hypothetical protein